MSMPHADLPPLTGTQGLPLISQPDLPQLCWSALHSSDPNALEQLRRHAKEVLKSWGDEEIQKALTVEPADSVPGARIAAVYEVLAEAEPCPALPIDTRKILLKANLTEEAEIGHAFKQNLLDGLNRPLNNLFLVFAAAGRVSARERRHLWQTASVEAAWPACAGMVACGLTPLGVFYATKTPFPLAKRLQERKILNPSSPVVLSYVRRSPRAPRPLAEFSNDVVREVLQVAHCSEQAAEILVDWLIDVAQVKPLVFSGAWAEPDQWGVRLTAYEDYTNKSLADRWGTVSGARVLDHAQLQAAQSGATAVSRP
jgi:hypothetical protein